MALIRRGIAPNARNRHNPPAQYAYATVPHLTGLDMQSFAHIRPRKLTEAYAKTLLPVPRLPDSHKGDYGSVGILGGADGMVGAALLAGRAALHMGAGRVYAGLLAHNHAPAVDVQQPELMLRPPHDLFKLELSVMVAGPGLGISSEAYFWLCQALESSLPLVLDADALNLIAYFPQLQKNLAERKAPSLLTPHPGEAARLLGCSASAVQKSRNAAALQLAQNHNSAVVLKGANSVCATPEGDCFINTSGNPGLASAGTGDVLAGMMGALIAQGLTAQNALVLAVYLHGRAADELVQQGVGAAGLTASELPDAARRLFNNR